DVLVELSLPPLQGQDPIVRRVTALPLSPSGGIRLQRLAGQPGPDLLALVGSANGSVTIYDAFQGQVVAQLPVTPVPGDNGDYPFAVAQLPGDPADPSRARFAVSI